MYLSSYLISLTVTVLVKYHSSFSPSLFLCHFFLIPRLHFSNLFVRSPPTRLWRNEKTELLGHECKFTVKPYLKRFQVYYKGRMWCPGWTAIRGEASTRSQSGVAGKTAKDFVRKAFQKGLISQQEANQWLSS
ncbi:anti-lipopolysaccharide factor-like isoform X1 [Penaeus monodon]|uniref:anti-lipopolysaccharide factor-like isoform X1 n=1 Tax=Penaeus monodon TaxID=6687 RepID=UPI0018A74D4B|nr:anti-lipopolysaccharide factor-like isoform X1 [Penaeus monodon]